ncbi:MAG TPA: M14 family metallopeptidase [Burkholderiales bacterium]|nr:M14 family metallopeptidase [Burkholderiales bacterium]
MRRARPLALALAVGLAWVLLPVRAAADETGEIVSIDKKEFLAHRLERRGLDLLMEKEGRVYAVVSPGELAALFAARVRFTRVTERFFPYDQTGISADGGLNGAYHSTLELETDFRALARDHPQLARVVELGTSLEGRTIYALKISDNVSQDEGEPAVLVLGCHHAREWISVEVPFLFGRYLLENYAADAAVRNLVDRSEVWIVPLVNPDGLEYTIHVYRYWRKNRRLNADGTYGVDINRNYSYAWGYDNIGSSPEPASDVFRGTAPFSEPETDAVRRLALSRDFRAVISYHSFSQVILYPWGYVDAPAPADSELHAMAGTMAGLIAAVRGTVYGYGRAAQALYVTNGDTVDWAYATLGIPAFTIELPPVDVDHGGFFNDEAAIDAIFRENLPALLYLAGYAANSPAPPHARPRDRGARLRLPFRILPGGRIDNGR